MDDTITQTVVSDSGFQPEREAQVGILHFVNSENIGFTGTLKQRYVLRVYCSLASSFDITPGSSALNHLLEYGLISL